MYDHESTAMVDQAIDSTADVGRNNEHSCAAVTSHHMTHTFTYYLGLLQSRLQR
jgi:hypothetical protein